MAAADTVPAEKTSGEASASDDHASRWSYTLGVKVQSSDVTNASSDLSIRPVLGLRYGRWRLGHPTGTEWLRFSGYRKESNLAYQLRENERLKVGLSLRLQNLKYNNSFDGFYSGQHTVRGRVSVNYRLDPRWSLGSDLTQDLMNKGDGTTLSVGASYGMSLNDRSAINWSAGVNWATADHWATQLRLAPVPEGGWHAGLGSLGLGMSYRYALTSQWAWFGTLGTSRPLGQLRAISPNHLTWSGQVGVLYFSR
jgi:outer membrane scaffolding protein for murein synthesis (MipA/OmpV family)